jgi:hypothetical protein
MGATIQQFTAHAIDHSNTTASAVPIAHDAELDSYLTALLDWAYDDEDMRRFHFEAPTTEVHSILLKLISGDKLVDHSDAVANRLLTKEKAAHDEVRHLKGVHEGMLLQAVFDHDGATGILLAKVDLSEFLKRSNFRSEQGIDKKHRLLKFCIIEFTNQQAISAVRVGDTNAKIAQYWWENFLELTEERTDSSNTKTVFAELDAFLAKNLKKDHPRDYPVLYNDMLRIFKRSQSFRFTKFLDGLFDNYRPESNSLDIADLKKRAKELLKKDKFDANFTILPDEIKNRFKKTFPLTPQIDLVVSGEIERDQISALALDDGTKGVFVKSDDGFSQFPERVTLHHAAKKKAVTLAKSPTKAVNLQSN